MGDWVGVVKGSEGGWGIGEPLAIVRQPEGSQFSETIRDGVGGRGQGGGGEGVRRKVKKYFQLNPLPPFFLRPFLFLPTFCPKLLFLSNISFLFTFTICLLLFPNHINFRNFQSFILLFSLSFYAVSIFPLTVLFSNYILSVYSVLYFFSSCLVFIYFISFLQYSHCFHYKFLQCLLFRCCSIFVICLLNIWQIYVACMPYYTAQLIVLQILDGTKSQFYSRAERSILKSIK